MPMVQTRFWLAWVDVGKKRGSREFLEPRLGCRGWAARCVNLLDIQTLWISKTALQHHDALHTKLSSHRYVANNI